MPRYAAKLHHPPFKVEAMARNIIELDEDLKVNPDETADRLEDIRSWAVDLAKAFFSTAEEDEIRKTEREGVSQVERDVEFDYRGPDFGHISEDQSPAEIAEQVEKAYNERENGNV
jgi:hypothetical protein